MGELKVERGPVGYDDWQKHNGGPNPNPDGPVDLIWGIGLVGRQPSNKVNWHFHWTWRRSGPPSPVTS